MVWIENQLVGAYEGQTFTLECHSEAYPRPITYWTRPSNETIANGKSEPFLEEKDLIRSQIHLFFKLDMDRYYEKNMEKKLT